MKKPPNCLVCRAGGAIMARLLELGWVPDITVDGFVRMVRAA